MILVSARAVRWLVATGLLAVAWLAFAAGQASAHAILLSTDPKGDTLLPQAPAAVTLTFNEPVKIWPTSVSVFDPAGERVKAEVGSVDTKVVAKLPANLAEGTYTVSWRVTSADDHPVSGGFAFSVGKRTTPAAVTPDDGEPTRSLNLTRLVANGLGYLGVLAGVGLAVFELLILRADPGAMPVLRRRLRRTARIVTGIGAVGLLASVPLTIAWQQAGELGMLSEGAVWSDGVRSDTAVSALLAIAGLVVAAWAVTRPRTQALAGVAVGSALALVSLPWTGHTRTYGPGWLVTASDLVHVSAGAVWLGGVIALVLTLAKSSDASPERAAATVARFSAIGAWLLGALAVAGTVMAWRILGSIRGLWETNYGIALLTKLGVVMVALGIAAWNRYRLLPAVVRTPRDRPARKILYDAVRAEAFLLVAVLGITGVLVTQPPKETSGGDTPATTTRARGVEERLGDNLVRIRISPVSVGRNYLQVYLRTTDGKAFEPATAPNIRFALPAEQLGPLAAPLERVGPGQYEGAVTLPVAGDWEVRITARTSKYESPSADLRIRIG